MRRTKNNRQIIFTLLICCFFLSSCSVGANKPNISPPNSFTGALKSLSSSTVQHFEEIEQIAIPGSGTIAALKYRSAENVVLVVEIGDGSLETWDLESKFIVSDYKLNIVSAQGLSFDDDGNYLVGATKHEYRNDTGRGESDEYIDGIKVWDTQTGMQAFCVTLCGDQANVERHSASLGSGLDPTGNWAFEYSEATLDVINIKTDNTSIALLSDPDWYWHYVGRVVFNSTGSKYAVAFQEGAVKIFNRNGLQISFPELSKNVDKDFKSIPALTFSPADRWLARIRDGKVTVWKVRGLGGTLQYESNLPESKLLAFDRSEELLFVGSNNAITVIDLAKKSILTTFSTPNITSFTVSSDNRLLIWGDSTGTIHIWGVR